MSAPRRSTRRPGRALVEAARNPPLPPPPADSEALRPRNAKKRCTCADCLRQKPDVGRVVAQSTYHDHQIIERARQQRAEEEAQRAAEAEAARLREEAEAEEQKQGDDDAGDFGFGGDDAAAAAIDYKLDSDGEAIMQDPPGAAADAADAGAESDAEPAPVVVNAESSDSEAEGLEDAELPPPPPEEVVAAAVNRGGRPALPALDLNQRAPGCETTLGELLTDLLTVADSNNFSQRARTQLFELFQRHMPTGNNVPHQRHAVKDLLSALPFSAKHYVVCPDDCEFPRVRRGGPLRDPSRDERILLDVSLPVANGLATDEVPPGKITEYQLEQLQSGQCSKCQKAFANAKKQFHKKFFWIGLEPQLRMLLQDRTLLPHLRLPWPGKGPEPADWGDAEPLEPEEEDDCFALHQSVGWWNKVHRLSLPRTAANGEELPPEDPEGWGPGGLNQAISVNVDGFQPFDRGGVTITPINAQLLNLPENLRHRQEFMLLLGVISRCKPKNYNTYLRLLVDELVKLRRDGLEFTHPVTGAQQTVKVQLLFTCADYPAHSDLNYQQGAGAYYGCHKCDIEGFNSMKRICYGEYRKLAWAERPKLLTQEELQTRAYKMQKLDRERVAQEKDVASQWYKKKLEAVDAKSVKGRSALLDLAPEFDLVNDTCIDLMHIVQGVIGSHIIPLIKGKRTVGYEEGGEDTRKLKKQVKELRRSLEARHDAASAKQLKRLEQDLQARKNAHAELKRTGGWNTSQQMLKNIESRAYTCIQAPVGIAPHSKAPFTRSGEMTAYHWLNFTKVHGKLLFAHIYGNRNKEDERRSERQEEAEQLEAEWNRRRAAPAAAAPAAASNDAYFPPLANRRLFALCSLFDLLNLCLRSHATKEVKQQTATAVRTLALHFESLFPPTECAIVMHLLFFHLPATIRRWGPARGYWCFPFERFIGTLAKSIKSSKHPEANLANRYVLTFATRSHRTLLQNAAQPEEDESADGVNADRSVLHPLVPLNAIHSLMDDQRVFWPERTKYNSRKNQQFKTIGKHARKRVLEPILGVDVCNEYQGKNSEYSLLDYTQPVQVGRWKYGLKVKEDGRQVGKTRASWFRMRGCDVPHLRSEYERKLAQQDHDPFEESPVGGDRWIYGRIIKFAELHVPNWRAEPFQLAEVMLYEEAHTELYTKYPIIDLSQPLECFDGDKWKIIKYVQVQHLRGQIAVAPLQDASRFILQRPIGPSVNPTEIDCKISRELLFVVMPLEV